ncbi:FAD-dependent oxidoreductase [Chryseobacterium sp. Leaf404]|uniref:NAD(P)/FAD-dependent oxidoreductase n=1 Tax=unclassified Chryseobacterium TaxID=2593645 RepID=UPI0006F24CCF|nr:MULTISPECIES: FAD-binding oxidoreductase [unclassified Chryseobacterium]KQT17028.1 FAD-dependent oxidoreductase [Chryseobacterium sp. Leaf404]
MENVDYIIVGDGYAALFFAHHLIREQKSFRLFSEGRKGASQVSAGIINPVVLKKFTTFWKAQEQINYLKNTLAEIERYTGKNYLVAQPIHRIFHDENEKNLWKKKAGTDELKDFLATEFSELSEVRNPYGTGTVSQSARLDVASFFSDMFTWLMKENYLVSEKFDYSKISPSDNIYKEYKFRNIIFCEGMGVAANPFFKDIPVIPNKGHHIKVQLQNDLKTKVTIKKKHFLFPLDSGLYFYGGTYDRDQLHLKIDDSATDQLVSGLAEIYPFDFEVKDISFGFRPTVKDRRPIVGRHHIHQNFYVFNGLGARGILNGCYFSKHLYDFIETNVPLPDEISSDRF